MPFTEQNKTLLEEASYIDFQFMKNGMINYRKHSKKELGLYFIKRAVEIHGNTYGYSNVEYKGATEKVILLCAHHNEFLQTPHIHLQGAGCSFCHGGRVLTKEEFIQKAQQVHGRKYDYSKVVYVNNVTNIKVNCPIHGQFFPTPSDHLRGCECMQCYHDSLKLSTEDFIRKSVMVHGDLYDYSLAIYVNSATKIQVLCLEHGPFFPTPSNHWHGTGCPSCANKNHNILYIFRCLTTGLYKIGITADNVKRRLYSLRGNLIEIHHVTLEEPGKHERVLHTRYASVQRRNEFMQGNGHTEFFSLTEDQVQEVIDYMDEVSNA